MIHKSVPPPDFSKLSNTNGVSSETIPGAANVDGTPVLATTQPTAKSAESSRFDLKQYGQSLTSVVAYMRNDPTKAEYAEIRDAKKVEIYGPGKEPPTSDKADSGLQAQTLKAAKERATFEFQQKYGENYNLPELQCATAKVGNRDVLLVTASGNSKMAQVDENKNIFQRGLDKLVGGVAHAARTAGGQPSVTLAYDIDKGIPLGLKPGGEEWGAAPLSYKDPISAAPAQAKAEPPATVMTATVDQPKMNRLTQQPIQSDPKPATEVKAPPEYINYKYTLSERPGEFYEAFDKLNPKSDQYGEVLEMKKTFLKEIAQGNEKDFKAFVSKPDLNATDKATALEHRKDFLATQHKNAKPSIQPDISSKEKPLESKEKPLEAALPTVTGNGLKVVSDVLDAKIASLTTQVDSAKAEFNRKGTGAFAKLSQELAGLNKLKAELNAPTPETVAGLLKFAGDEIAAKKAEQDQAKRNLNSPKVAELNIQIQALEGFQNSLKPAERPQLSHVDRVRQFDEKIAALDAKRDELFKLDPNGGGKEMQAYNSERAKLVQQRAELIRG